MASPPWPRGSGVGGDRSPAPPAVMDDLFALRHHALVFQTMLDEGSPTPSSPAERRGLVLELEGMVSSVTSALSTLSTSGGIGGGASSALNTIGGGDGGGASSYAGGRGSGGPHRRRSSGTTNSSCRRRTLSPFLETVTTTKLEDGHAWRKYGQKRIQDSENPRSYYRCTHMPDQGCKARKQVQVSDANPSEYIVSYFGKHTCRDLSTVPLVIEAAATAPPDCANFICFGGTSSQQHVAPQPQRNKQAVAVDPSTVLSRLAAAGAYSSSLPAAAAKERCGSEEAISGISASSSRAGGQLEDVVRSAPEYWWPPSDLEGGGIGTGSFPSSPSSLGGFITCSFESFGNGVDDDLFGFDP